MKLIAKLSELIRQCTQCVMNIIELAWILSVAWGSVDGRDSLQEQYLGIIDLNSDWVQKQGIEGTMRLGTAWNNQLNDSGFKVKVYVETPKRVVIVAQSETEINQIRKIIKRHSPAVETYVGLSPC